MDLPSLVSVSMHHQLIALMIGLMIGLDWIVDCIGLHWIALHWIGLDWIGLEIGLMIGSVK